MQELFLLIIVGTSIWVLIDAKSIGVKEGQIKGLGNMGPWGWFFASLLLWIIGFPLYLAKRNEFKLANQTANPVNASDDISQLEKLADLKERGILTEDEFQAKKRDLLNRPQ